MDYLTKNVIKEMIKDFLAKLGANTKITIGVSVSPGVGLEMIEIDSSTKTVNKYGCKPLEYNYSTREIFNYVEFQEALGDLFDELHIPRKSNIILTLPNVHFGVIGLPLLLTDDAVTNAIISEVEQSYIFKRQEPLVSWIEVSSNIDTEKRNLAYTAVQQTTMDGIKAACQEVGCNLTSVETSYSSFLKTLYYTDLAKDQMKENTTWNLMIIGQNNYSIFSMVGKKIIEHYEEPLALKSFVDDEIYNAISTSAQLTLAGLPANYLFIASETDLVSAEVLSLKLPFVGTVNFLECNKYSQKELVVTDLNILPNLALKITPEAIGSAIYMFCDFPIKFNLTGEKELAANELAEGEYPRINIGNTEVEITPDLLKKICIIILVAVVIPIFLLSLLLEKFVNSEQAKLTQLTTNVTNKTAEISKFTKDTSTGAFDINSTIDKITSLNRTKLFYYSAVGMSTPNKLWVDYYMTNTTGGIDIKGKSTDVNSIYSFYKGVKQLVNNSNIRLHKLEVSSDSVDAVVSSSSGGPKFYNFEITNMTPEELNPPAEGATPAAGTPAAPGQPATPGQPPAATPAPGQPPAPPTPSQPTPPNTTPGQLPKNLEKIEKF